MALLALSIYATIRSITTSARGTKLKTQILKLSAVLLVVSVSQLINVLFISNSYWYNEYNIHYIASLYTDEVFYGAIYANRVFIPHEYLAHLDLTINGLANLFDSDRLGCIFTSLTFFLIFFCILLGWNIKKNFQQYAIVLFLLGACLCTIFTTTSMLKFYIFFELAAIPTYLLVIIWGSRKRRFVASYYFYFYTILTSFFFFLAIIYFETELGTSDIKELSLFDNLSYFEQLYLAPFLLIPFLAKIPTMPLHAWLPETHVEAPTAGSVILAGVLLKVGLYGLIRFVLPLVPDSLHFYEPAIATLCLISIFYASTTACRQVDFKKVIAYASIAHINLAIVALINQTNLTDNELVTAIVGASHGFSSAALFAGVGLLYDRAKTRLITNYGGLVETMPLMSTFLVFFSLCNMGFPGTFNFIGEILAFGLAFASNTLVGVLSTLTTILCCVYSLLLLVRLIYGAAKPHSTLLYLDVSLREATILIGFSIPILLFGVQTSVF